MLDDSVVSACTLEIDDLPILLFDFLVVLPLAGSSHRIADDPAKHTPVCLLEEQCVLHPILLIRLSVLAEVARGAYPLMPMDAMPPSRCSGQRLLGHSQRPLCQL